MLLSTVWEIGSVCSWGDVLSEFYFWISCESHDIAPTWSNWDWWHAPLTAQQSSYTVRTPPKNFLGILYWMQNSFRSRKSVISEINLWTYPWPIKVFYLKLLTKSTWKIIFVIYFFLRMAVETFNLKDRSKKSSKQQFFLNMIFLVLDFWVNEFRIVKIH